MSVRLQKVVAQSVPSFKNAGFWEVTVASTPVIMPPYGLC